MYKTFFISSRKPDNHLIYATFILDLVSIPIEAKLVGVKMKRTCSIIFLIFIISIPLFSQKLISGYIRDRETKQPLAAANIQIVGTFHGTISNTEGKYLLQLNKLPSTILVSYIGYQSQQVTINRNHGKFQDI